MQIRTSISAGRFGLREQPILLKEMRALMRHRRMPAVLFACAALAVGAGAFILGEALGGGVTLGVEESARLGHRLFGGLMLLEGVLIVLLAPALTGGAIAGEEERRTLEPLLLSRLSIREILAGKLLAALGVQGIVLLCALPVVAVAFIFGGVSPWDVIFFTFALLSIAACCGATGIYLSARCRRSATALVLAFCLMLAWVVLTVPCAILCLLIRFYEAAPTSEHEEEPSSTRVVAYSVIIYGVGIVALFGIFNLGAMLYFLAQYNFARLSWDVLQDHHPGSGGSNAWFALLFFAVWQGVLSRSMLASAERAIRRRWQGGMLT